MSNRARLYCGVGLLGCRRQICVCDGVGYVKIGVGGGGGGGGGIRECIGC